MRGIKDFTYTIPWIKSIKTEDLQAELENRKRDSESGTSEQASVLGNKYRKGGSMRSFGNCNEIIYYNGDFSGNVYYERYKDSGEKELEVRIPGQFFLDFIANYIRSKRIEKLEQTDALGIFGTV